MLPISATSPKFENTFQNRRLFSDKQVNDLLTKYTLLDLKTVRAMYNLPGRYYHNWDHVQYLLSLTVFLTDTIEQVLSEADLDSLRLAIIFHDIIYAPGGRQNEVLSARFWQSTCKIEVDQSGTIYNAILWTDYMNPAVRLATLDEDMRIAYWLQTLDLYQLITEDRSAQLFNFCMVWEEFGKLAQYNRELFEQKQNDFLRALAEKYNFVFNRDITWDEIKRELDKPFEIDLEK